MLFGSLHLFGPSPQSTIEKFYRNKKKNTTTHSDYVVVCCESLAPVMYETTTFIHNFLAVNSSVVHYQRPSLLTTFIEPRSRRAYIIIPLDPSTHKLSRGTRIGILVQNLYRGWYKEGSNPVYCFSIIVLDAFLAIFFVGSVVSFVKCPRGSFHIHVGENMHHLPANSLAF